MKPEFAIERKSIGKDSDTVFVSMAKAKYQGIDWTDLSSFGKRKFENLLKLQISAQDMTKKIVKVVYV